MTDDLKTSTTSTLEVAGHNGNGQGKIRVVDDEGHLLFIYNPSSREIEFIPLRGRRDDKTRKVLCVISADALMAFGLRSLLALNETEEFVAQVHVLIE